MIKHLLLLTLLLCPQLDAAEVLATIKPLQLIAQAITPEVDLLIPAGVDMHDFSLAPSSRKKLDSKALLLWLGPVHEPYLAKIAIAKAPIQQLDLTPLIAAQRADDPHLWMSPKQASTIAQQLAGKLSQLHPENAAAYQANLARFQQQLAQLEPWVQAQLEGLSFNYLVFHDAYHYFEDEFGLKPRAILSNQHGQNPGAKTWAAILKQVAAGDIDCALFTPEASSALVARLKEKGVTRMVLLDPLAASINAGPEGYVALIKTTTQAFKSCGQRTD